jgi:hypothetical protein
VIKILRKSEVRNLIFYYKLQKSKGVANVSQDLWPIATPSSLGIVAGCATMDMMLGDPIASRVLLIDSTCAPPP